MEALPEYTLTGNAGAGPGPFGSTIVIALGGVALLVVGWRLRMKNSGYALSMQGGGVAVLYLTVFAALRLKLWDADAQQMVPFPAGSLQSAGEGPDTPSPAAAP